MNESEILGTSGGKDDRGLITVTVPHLALTLEEALVIGPRVILGRLEESGRSFRATTSGHFEVEITYEGEDGSKSDQERSEEAVYSAQSSFREEPIESHPKIKELMKKYEGVEDQETGRVKFYSTLSNSEGTNALAGEAGIAQEKPNPMAGVEKYMALEIIWTRSYIQRQKPAGIFEKVGRVIKNPPGGPPRVKGRSSWLVMPPKLTKRGQVWEVEEQWTLLPEGTPEDVYNL